MPDPVEALILDLLEWIGTNSRPYREVMEAWRTSCPRLPVWEEATERGFIERHHEEGSEAMVSVSARGARFFAEHRPSAAWPASPRTSRGPVPPSPGSASPDGDLVQGSVFTTSETGIGVPGLTYVPGYVDEREAAGLIEAVDTEPWLDDLKRRVQHYGYRYDYKVRKVDRSMYLGPLPAWAEPLAARLTADGHMPDGPDQLIVNEYEPGQGITPHVDCVPCFGPVVCSLTLGSHCIMVLSEVGGGRTESLLLEPRSLLVLAGEARYRWRHAIPGRKTDEVEGRALARGRRVSLTFRSVIHSG